MMAHNILLPDTKITDEFGHRDLKWWDSHGRGYRVWHYGTDYRSGIIYCPCDAVVYGERVSDGRGAITYIIPIEDEKPVEHTIITLFHREPPPSKWESYSRGDQLIGSRAHYGLGGPHTHFEIDCTLDSPYAQLVQDAGRREQVDLQTDIVAFSKGLKINTEFVARRAEWQAQTDGLVYGNCRAAEQRCYLVTTRWAPDRLCKISRVGREKYTMRINPEILR